MSVEFEEQEFAPSTQMPHEERGAVTKLIFKLGLAKNPAQADVVMLIIAVIAIGLTVYLLLPANTTPPATPIIPVEEEIPG
jgi:hypothetical protein